MSNFRTRILGLAAVATAFAGISYGQAPTVACTGITTLGTPNPSLRSEGQTELVADVQATGCTATNAPVGGIIGTVYATLSVPVTSKALTAAQAAGPVGSGNVGNSEAILTVGATVYYGTVSGTQVAFTGVTFPAGPVTITTSNVRVNASGGGAPQVTETMLISYPSNGNTSNLPLAAQNVGYILQSISASSLVAPATPYVTCTGNVFSNAAAAPAPAASFTLTFKELFGGAFKTAAQENGSVVLGPAGTANTATQLLVTLANVPATSSVYLPLTVTSVGGGVTMTLANATAATTPTSIAAIAGGAVLFTPANGGVTATYVVTASTPASGGQTVNIPVWVGIPQNTPVQSAITALVYYTPTGTVTGPATTIPTFIASSQTPSNASAIGACQTSLLFPFVTNQLGFDTGIVLANTTTDNLATGGKSTATPSAGTCTLSFYGAGAPTPATGVADPLGSTASGTTHAFVVSSVAPGFQGYAIATCPFLDAHGYAFLAYNLTQTNGAVQGYLALVLNNRTASAAETVTF